MRHPTDGALRRLVDEPAGVADADREHVADCPACLAGLVAARDDAAEAERSVAVEVAVDVDAAWQRLSRSAALVVGVEGDWPELEIECWALRD